MRTLRHTRRGPLRRAATMIEFTLVIPVFLFMMLFSIDMGMLMLTHGAMTDTAFSAARAGAQAGGAGVEGEMGGECLANGPCTAGVSFDVLQEGVENLPLSDRAWSFDESQFQILSGAQCRTDGQDSFVTVEVPYEVEFMTPGLSNLLGITDDGTRSNGSFEITSTGVARCEVYRNQ